MGLKKIIRQSGISSTLKSDVAKPQVILATVVVCLLLMEFWVIKGSFRHLLTPTLTAVLPVTERFSPWLGWAAGCLLCYLLIPLITIKLVIKQPLSKFGLQWGEFPRYGWLYFIMLAPFFVIIPYISRQPDFQAIYPFCRPNDHLELLLWECAYAIQFISLEFFFRGFLLHGLKPYIGARLSIWVMVIPYVMIHHPKPALEAWGALLAGLALGWLAVRTRSIWGGALLHITVAWTNDLMALWHRGWFSGGG